jgi:hypothetical protein
MDIKKLVLYTSDLPRQLHFYKNTLRFPAIDIASNYFELDVGTSILRFELRNSPHIPYHFAINIPSNKAVEALQWLRPLTPLINYNNTDLINFTNWNAQSIYFFDKEQNIVELIARSNLQKYSNLAFNGTELLGISEIGMAVESIETTYNTLNQIKQLPIYDGNFEKFCAAGDECGLFIIVDSRTKQWFPTDINAQPADFIIEGDYNFEFRDGAVIV